MTLMEGEEILMEMEPEPQMLVIWFFKGCLETMVFLGMIFLLSIPVFGGLFETISYIKNNLLELLWVIPFIITYAVIYPIYLWRTYGYTLTNRRVIFSNGMQPHVQHSVPYYRITDVKISQNIFERMLGISSLKIYTNKTGVFTSDRFWRRAEITFAGLKDNETPAETINHILSTFKATGE